MKIKDKKINKQDKNENMEMWRSGGSLVMHQTSGAEVTGSNPAPPTMNLMHCRIIVK